MGYNSVHDITGLSSFV